MDVKRLRKVVKAMVKECINEVLADKFLEHRISESVQVKPSLYREAIEAPAPATNSKAVATEQDRQNMRRVLLERVAPDDDADPMNSVFATTKSIEEREQDCAGQVSEKTMKEIGIFDKDWSKYI